MKLKLKSPSQSVSKAFIREGVSEKEMDIFRANLLTLIDSIDPKESEENVKNYLSRFLTNTYYGNDYEINTKNRTDLVIFTGKTARKSKVGVLFEVKRPSNIADMVLTDNLNRMAMREIIRYYFEEREKHSNNEIKHLIITNIYEWFIFDANQFDKLIYRNPAIKQLYKTCESDKKDARFFYEELGKIIPQIDAEITGTYFDIRKYEKRLKSEDIEEQEELIPVYKIFSPTHLLKQEFDNDSNSLNKPFYNELLYIIGLEEKSDGGKRVITRVGDSKRSEATLIENTITKLKAHGALDDFDKKLHEGITIEDHYFDVALELAITWINRILFLKLLESQLIGYHNNNQQYAFLSSEKIKEFNNLDALFFEVLAEKTNNRPISIKERYPLVPYLNSSLFEPTKLEKKTAFISDLKEDLKIPVFSKTALKDKQGKSLKGTDKKTLEYLLQFLSAYDFGTEGKEMIKKESKTIINASVLGRIFEKINGYKDGSYFTPGFITEYMCRSTIRKAVINKLSDYFNRRFETFEGLVNYTRRNLYEPKEIQAVNKVMNELRICDPAVGSGHFLVSALNELISIKSQLGILCDKYGKTLEKYTAKVENDELIIESNDEEQFKYSFGKDGKPNPEIQRIQETLFHEKKTVIENCLFGVDINSNSVKICRLRLWIELLKNAYYTPESNFTELETLPNIDINIKCGNSLVSRFAIDTDLKQAPKKSKGNIDNYRIAVATYRNSDNKEQKRYMERLISEIKSDYRSEISLNDPKVKKLRKLYGELFQMTNQQQLFNMSKKENATWSKKLAKLTEETQKIETEIEKIKANKIFDNAFEWRFEFPEVLNDDGDFVGFDVVIGNPPYLSYYSGMAAWIPPQEHEFYRNNYDFITNRKAKSRISTVMLFLELSTKILRLNGQFSNIIDINLFSPAFDRIRRFLIEKIDIEKIVTNLSVFAGVGSGQILLFYKNEKKISNNIEYLNGFESQSYFFDQKKINADNNYSFQFDMNMDIVKKIKSGNRPLNDCCHIISGMNIGGVKDYFLSETRVDESYHIAILSGNIFRYKLDYPNEVQKRKKRNNYIRFDKSIEKYIWDNKIGTPSIGADDSKFRKEKLLVRRPLTGDGKLAAAYSDNHDHYSDVTVYVINETIISIKYLLGIINSKLATWYCRKAGIIRFEKGQQPQITITRFKDFPIPTSDNQNIVNLIDLVNTRIITNDIKIIEEVESKIDQLVYQIYNLTEDEIQIIEESIK